MRLALLSLVPMLIIAAPRTLHFKFTSGNHIISMEVRFLAPYVGTRLVFYDTADSSKEICVRIGESARCPERFVGAVATVKFSVKRLTGHASTTTSIREYVTEIGHSPGLVPRPPFEQKQRLGRGFISDLQAFGYDESYLSEGERAAVRKESRDVWRVFRQELSLNDEREAFATIQWRHTIDRLEIVAVDGVACPEVERDRTLSRFRACGDQQPLK
jgi:hypothetical protein